MIVFVSPLACLDWLVIIADPRCQPPSLPRCHHLMCRVTQPVAAGQLIVCHRPDLASLIATDQTWDRGCRDSEARLRRKVKWNWQKCSVAIFSLHLRHQSEEINGKKCADETWDRGNRDSRRNYTRQQSQVQLAEMFCRAKQTRRDMRMLTERRVSPGGCYLRDLDDECLHQSHLARHVPSLKPVSQAERRHTRSHQAPGS